MKIFPWLLASLAFAAPKKPEPPASQELWSLAFPAAEPVAVFFDAASSSLLVSLAEKGGGGRVDRVTLEGKLDQARVARGEGRPGPLRAFGPQIYWISGPEVRSFGPNGNVSEGSVPPELGAPVDIAVGRGNNIYVGTASGALYRPVAGAVRAPELRGDPVTGIFLLDDTLYLLRGTRLQALRAGAGANPQSSTTPLCKSQCYGLERTSDGTWLTTRKGGVLEASAKSTRVWLATDARLGRPAYVYRKDSKEDFYVIPFPAEGVVRAYRHSRKNAP